MVDAPERIWVSKTGTWLSHENPSQLEPVEYVRADLHTELEAENERLKQEVENWKTSAAGWQKIANVDAEAFSRTRAVNPDDLTLIHGIVLPMVRDRSREPGDAWDRAASILSALDHHPRATNTVDAHETANVIDKPEGQQEPVAYGEDIDGKIVSVRLDKSRHCTIPLYTRPSEAVTEAARDVLAERHRQVAVEGWTPEHDRRHASGELAIAAACYALNATDDSDGPEIRFVGAELWPWADEWWKPTDPRRDLVKAGALILAEIERTDRRAALKAAMEAGG